MEKLSFSLGLKTQEREHAHRLYFRITVNFPMKICVCARAEIEHVIGTMSQPGARSEISARAETRHVIGQSVRSTSRSICWVGSYLLLNTIFYRLYSVVLPIVFCAKSIVIFVRSIVLLANPEVPSMRYDTTQFVGIMCSHLHCHCVSSRDNCLNCPNNCKVHFSLMEFA